MTQDVHDLSAVLHPDLQAFPECRRKQFPVET